MCAAKVLKQGTSFQGKSPGNQVELLSRPPPAPFVTQSPPNPIPGRGTYPSPGVRSRLAGVLYHLNGVSYGLAPLSLNAKSVGELSGIA